MKTKRKALLVVLAAVLLLSVSVLGTLAWLYDTEEESYTAFTVGDVDITLAVDRDWAANASANEWVPNQDYSMDPTITVKAGSEAAYVRMFVTVTDAHDLLVAAADVDRATDAPNIFLFHNYVNLTGGEYYQENQYAWNNGGANNWNFASAQYVDNGTADESDDTLVYEFRYALVTDETDADYDLPALFDTFTLPFYFNNKDVDSLAEMTVKFEAQAIQAYEKGHDDLFTDADKAWAAFEAQMSMTSTYEGRLGNTYEPWTGDAE